MKPLGSLTLPVKSKKKAFSWFFRFFGIPYLTLVGVFQLAMSRATAVLP